MARLRRFRLLALASAAALSGPAGVDADVPFRFVDVSGERGIGELRMLEAMGGGVAAADFDDDGDVDLFVPNTEGAPDQLYRNRGDGSFEEIAAEAGVAWTGRSRIGLFFDYDGDHRLDLFVAGDCYNEPPACAETSTLRLYRQVDDARFEDVTIASELPDDVVEGRTSHRGGAAAGDVNGDGFLDLLVGLWFGRVQVFLNDGDGTFTDGGLATGIGLPHGNSWQVFIHDFTRDGLTDVYVAIDFAANHFWANQDGGVFADEAHERGCDNAWNDMGIAGGDYDNDGDLDLYVTNISGARGHSVLYRNDGAAASFVDVAVEAGVDNAFWGWGCTFLDADNDGRLDLAATNGWIDGPSREDPSRFFLNAGGAPVAFAEVSDAVGFNDTHWGSSLVALDANRDGCLDLVQTCNGSGDLPAAVRLLENEPDHEHGYLVVKPRMKGPNGRAIGAVVRVTAGGATMMRLVTAGTSFLGQEPAEAFFGLGAAKRAERVVVEWPDGRVARLDDVAANQVLTVVQEIAADLDEDGRVGFTDLVTLLASWGDCPDPPDPCRADVNGDGVVDARDAALLLEDWG